MAEPAKTVPETTTIQIDRDTWQQLNSRKRGPEESFDDVICRLLEETED